MPLTESERTKRELSMYGCTGDEARKGIDALVTSNLGNVPMSLGSILSDCQEMLAIATANRLNGDKCVAHLDQARQYLNRVKMALFAADILLWAEDDDEACVKHAIKFLAELSQACETPGVAPDQQMDELIEMARVIQKRPTA